MAIRLCVVRATQRCRYRKRVHAGEFICLRSETGVEIQKSLVILSHLPFPTLFFNLLDRIAPLFFTHGYSALEATCHDIARWPDPIDEHTIDLLMANQVLRVDLASHTLADTHLVRC